MQERGHDPQKAASREEVSTKGADEALIGRAPKAQTKISTHGAAQSESFGAKKRERSWTKEGS
jgi:hypothetical protein